MSSPMLTVSGPAAEVVASDGGVVLNVPIALKRRSGRRVVTVAGAVPVVATRAGATPGVLSKAIAWVPRGLEVVQWHRPGWKFRAADTMAATLNTAEVRNFKTPFATVVLPGCKAARPARPGGQRNVAPAHARRRGRRR